MKDNGEILGIEPNCIEKMKKNFVIAINNANKMYAHRDYSSGYVVKMVIEKNRIFAENNNRIHGFETFPKNTAILKAFREIGLADELDSGMRNTYIFWWSSTVCRGRRFLKQ